MKIAAWDLLSHPPPLSVFISALIVRQGREGYSLSHDKETGAEQQTRRKARNRESRSGLLEAGTKAR